MVVVFLSGCQPNAPTTNTSGESDKIEEIEQKVHSTGPVTIDEAVDHFPTEIVEPQKFPFKIGETIAYVDKYQKGLFQEDIIVSLKYYAKGVDPDPGSAFTTKGPAVEYNISNSKNLIEEINKPGSLESFKEDTIGHQTAYFHFDIEDNASQVVWWDGEKELVMGYIGGSDKKNENELREILIDLYSSVNQYK
ncbi:hypothetical protein EQV77_13075 [Halobacillus fulvus]|nr:hypothetical protein EQV77_13075 [Halobacillus fulvus]